eukprot:7141027-Pyramimonas_sp.AAC.1
MADIVSDIFLPVSLHDTALLPRRSHVGVGPPRFADWMKQKGAAERMPWEDVPTCTLPRDDQFHFPAMLLDDELAHLEMKRGKRMSRCMEALLARGEATALDPEKVHQEGRQLAMPATPRRNGVRA